MGSLLYSGSSDLASVTPVLFCGWVTCRHGCESPCNVGILWMGQLVDATAYANCSMLPASLPRARSACSPSLCLSRTHNVVTYPMTFPPRGRMMTGVVWRAVVVIACVCRGQVGVGYTSVCRKHVCIGYMCALDTSVCRGHQFLGTCKPDSSLAVH